MSDEVRKKDAIISIEFKNYCGKVVANENGEWTCDGKTIKGGSRKTVLQQARINHSTVKKELKVLGVEKNQIKDLTSSSCHPKVFVKEFSYFLMPCH